MSGGSKSGMTCGQARELAGDEQARANPQFFEHIAACQACRELDAELRALDPLLACWTPPQPVGLESRVMAGIAQAERELRECERRRGLTGRFARILWLPKVRLPAAVAAALALLLIASLATNGVLLARRDGPQPIAPAHNVAVLPPEILKSIAPVLAPNGGAEAGALTGRSLQYSGAGPIPMGVIVILGVPPVSPAVKKLPSDI